MVTHVKNRLLHIEAPKHLVQSASLEVPKSHNDILDCTLEEVALIKFVKEKPQATQKEIAVHIGKSERTVKRMTTRLSERGIIERKNGKRMAIGRIKAKSKTTKIQFIYETLFT